MDIKVDEKYDVKYSIVNNILSKSGNYTRAETKYYKIMSSSELLNLIYSFMVSPHLQHLFFNNRFLRFSYFYNENYDRLVSLEFRCLK